MIHRFYRLLFGMKTRERLPRLPRRYANEFDGRAVDRAEAVIFARTAARDQIGIQRLKRRYSVETLDELAALLPYQQPKPDWQRRLVAWLQRLSGETPFESVVRPYARSRERHVDR